MIVPLRRTRIEFSCVELEGSSAGMEVSCVEFTSVKRDFTGSEGV